MLSLATRKISGFGFSFALAALLLDCATAAAAGAPGDAQDQAAALLSRSAVNVERSAITLAPAATPATSADPLDQARRLLAGASAIPQDRQDDRATATPAVSPAGAMAAYANAEESARRMILGTGA